ncbi:unnamed protein product [Symbiodinium sp. CCMP2592]|nr:unnamed protein product [Symbiodinium sp. CCMP2592]
MTSSVLLAALLSLITWALPGGSEGKPLLVAPAVQHMRVIGHGSDASDTDSDSGSASGSSSAAAAASLLVLVCLACKQKEGEIDRDNPAGFEQVVEFFSGGAANSGPCLCKWCFYLKRGSLNNMRISELLGHLDAKPDFRDKHEKPDVKVLLERKEEQYVDVFSAMTWRSVKKFCDDEYPSMTFRNDSQRKAFIVRQGFRLQADDKGVEGVVTAKDADDLKEIKVGKRLAASKIRTQDLEDASDYSREQIAAMQAKNAAGLAIQMNEEDVNASKLPASQSPDDEPNPNKGDDGDEEESASSEFGLAAPAAPPKSRVRGKNKSQSSKPTVEHGGRKKTVFGSPLKVKAAAAETLPAEFDQLKAVMATDIINNVQIVHDVFGKLRGNKPVLPVLQDEGFAAELTKALQTAAMDPETLAAVLTYLCSKVAAEGGPRWFLRMVSVADPATNQCPDEDEDASDFKPIWSFHALFNVADRVDQILLRSQSSGTYAWVEGLKSMEQLDETILCIPPESLARHPGVLRAGVKTGAPSLECLKPELYDNQTGLNAQVLTDWQRIQGAIYVRSHQKHGSGSMPNGLKLYLKEVVSASSYSSRVAVLMRQPPWKQLWAATVTEAKSALEGQTLVGQGKKQAAAVMEMLEAFTAADENGMRDTFAETLRQKQEACALNLQSLLSDVQKFAKEEAEDAEGNRAAAEACEELSGALKLLEECCNGPLMHKVEQTAQAVIGKFWAARPDGAAAPIHLEASPVDRPAAWTKSDDDSDEVPKWFDSLVTLCAFFKILGSSEGRSKAVSFMCDFVKKVKGFYELVGSTNAEAETLNQACQFYVDMEKKTSKQENCKGEKAFEAAAAAMGRLKASIAAAAKAWISALLSNTAADEVVTKVNGTLAVQTPEIKAAVASLNLTKELASSFPLPEDVSLAQLGASTALYIKASSADENLVDPATLRKSREFCEQVDGALSGHVEIFEQTVAELQKLTEKYRRRGGCVVRHVSAHGILRPVKQCAAAWDMKDVAWMFDSSEEVDAEVKLILSLREEASDAMKSAEKIGSMLDAVPANTSGQKLRELCIKDLRVDAATTVGTLLGCDVILNPKHAGKQKQVCADVFKFIGSSLGITRRDLMNVSSKLVAQLQQFEDVQGPKKRAVAPSVPEFFNCIDVAPACLYVSRLEWTVKLQVLVCCMR